MFDRRRPLEVCAAPPGACCPRAARALGLTLVELLVAVAVIAMLAVFSWPQWRSGSHTEDPLSVTSVAGAAASGQAINHAHCLMRQRGLPVPAGAAACQRVRTCADARLTMPDGWPEGFELEADLPVGHGHNGVEATCTVRRIGTRAPVARFVAISAGNP